MDTRFELHRTRVRKGIDLARISAITALPPGLVAKIDEGRFEELPPGIYARSYVRAFAQAVGLNPHHALVDLEPLLPVEPDPLPLLREHAPPSALESLQSFLASQRAAGPLVRRAAVAAVDALVLLAIGAAMTILAASTCGVPVQVLLEHAGAELALTFSLPVGLYFLLLERLARQTLGGLVFGGGREWAGRIVVRVRACAPVAPPELRLSSR